MGNKIMPLFINFSNHPSQAWDEKQMAAALQFGNVVDLPFPQVDPAASTTDVSRLAQQCVEQIMALGQGRAVTVHAMGEMTLVFQVVSTLKRLGVRCVNSTTERITTEEGNKKVSLFNFVQFREY